MTGSATWRNLQHGDLCERDCVSVRMAKKIPLHCGTPQGSDNRGRTLFMRNGSYIRFSPAVAADFVIFVAAR